MPPDILNQADTDGGGMTMTEGDTNEGGSISLVCQATGVPEPTVQWRREGGKDIVLRGDGREKQSKIFCIENNCSFVLLDIPTYFI